MSKFDEYKNRYKYVRMRREDGILEMQLHSGGSELRWSSLPDKEIGDCLWEVGQDIENRCIILTGTGKHFCTEMDQEDTARAIKEAGGPIELLTNITTNSQGIHLQLNHLAVEVPIIAAVNGPATIHAEVALLSDIVICSDDTYFQDAPHFPGGVLAPGDGVHVIWPLLLGPSLGRYFLLSGMKMSAKEAWQRGVVAEVHKREDLTKRAWDIAREIAKRPVPMLRATRGAMVYKLRKEMLDLLPYGLATESKAAMIGYHTKTAFKNDMRNPIDFSAGARREPA